MDNKMETKKGISKVKLINIPEELKTHKQLYACIYLLVQAQNLENQADVLNQDETAFPSIILVGLHAFDCLCQARLLSDYQYITALQVLL